MKKITIPMLKIVVVASAFAVLTSTVRANVYATDIQINGTLTGTVSTIPTPVSPATITYHLNEAATAGCTVNILRGSTTVATIAGGTNQGLNAVRWGGTNNSGGVAGIGTFSVSITTAATGFPTWQQTSPLSTNTAMVLVHGLAVDKNTNSPYYGRIMAGCAISSSGTANGVTQKTGIYKFNADFTPADEGNYGYGGYTTDDAGNTAVGQMPSDGYGDIPYRLQVGDDDRLYMLDWTGSFAVIAFDMQVTTNQIVINESGYSGNPYFSSINAANFDVPQAGTTNATVWMYNNAFNTFGVWYWHVLPSTGQADPSDTVGNWAVTCDNGVSPVSLLPSGGGQIDLNNNIFVSEYRLNLGDGSLRTME